MLFNSIETFNLKKIIDYRHIPIFLTFTWPSYAYFTVKAADTLGFNTNEAAKYGKNIRCRVNYIMEASCNKMMMSCKLKLGTGDFFYVQRDDNTKK